MMRTLWLLALAACSSKTTDIPVTGVMRTLAADADGVVLASERDQKSLIEYVPTKGPRVAIKNGAWSIMAVALDADTIYWADLRHLRSAKRGATTFADLVQLDDQTIEDMAIAGADIYWTADGVVYKAPRTGGAANAVEKVWAPTSCRPRKLAAASAGLVVACNAMRAAGEHDTQIWKLGSEQPMATTPGVIFELVSDGTRVVWTTQAGTQLATHELGDTAAIPRPEITGRVLAVSGSSIVWAKGEDTFQTNVTTSTRIADYGTDAAIVGDQALIYVHRALENRGAVRRAKLR